MPTPVKAAAVELGLPVSHDINEVIDSGPSSVWWWPFGRLIKPPVLAVPMINLHFSLLALARGRAVERALLAGDELTGVCVMHVDETLDTGDVYARDTVSIGPETTADELRVDGAVPSCSSRCSPATSCRPASRRPVSRRTPARSSPTSGGSTGRAVLPSCTVGCAAATPGRC